MASIRQPSTKTLGDVLEGHLDRFDLQLGRQEALLTRSVTGASGYSAESRVGAGVELDSQQLLRRQERVLFDLLELQSRAELVLRSLSGGGASAGAASEAPSAKEELPTWLQQNGTAHTAQLVEPVAVPHYDRAEERDKEREQIAAAKRAEAARSKEGSQKASQGTLAVTQADVQAAAHLAPHDCNHNASGFLETKETHRAHMLEISEKLLCGLLAPGRQFSWLRKWIVWYLRVQEPPRTGALSNLIRAPLFECVCMGVIICNAIFAAMVADEEVQRLGEAPSAWVNVCEKAFIAWYTVELALKIAVHRLHFFNNEDWAWNCFDFLLLAQALLELLTELLMTASSNSNLMLVRMFRLLKLTKVIRLVRVFRFFRELRVMMLALKDSVVSLFWCITMLYAILYLFSLIIMQGVVTALLMSHEEAPGYAITDEQFDRAHELYGGVFACMLTLYKASTGGDDWGEAYELASLGGMAYSIMFLFYIAFFTFAVFNILTGVFVENVIANKVPDSNAVVTDWHRRMKDHVDSVKELFTVFDQDGSGKISWDEFQMHIGTDAVQAFLEAVDLHVQDAEMFFKILTRLTEVHEVDMESFVEGCLRIKGQASSLDLQAVLYQNSVILKTVHMVRQDLENEVDKMHERMTVVHQAVGAVQRQSLPTALPRPVRAPKDEVPGAVPMAMLLDEGNK